MNEKNETVVEARIKEGLLDAYVAGQIYKILRRLNREQLKALKESIDVEMQIKNALDMTY